MDWLTLSGYRAAPGYSVLQDAQKTSTIPPVRL